MSSKSFYRGYILCFALSFEIIFKSGSEYNDEIFYIQVGGKILFVFLNNYAQRNDE